MKIVGTIAASRLHGIVSILGLVFLGCSGTTVVKPGQNLYVDEPGILVKRSGQEVAVQRTLIRNDSILFTESREGQRVHLPVADADRLKTRNRGLGAWQGAVLFAGAGAVLGAIPDPNCGDTCILPNGGLGGSLFVAFLAAPAGALCGAVLGRRRDYIFAHPASEPDSVATQSSL